MALLGQKGLMNRKLIPELTCTGLNQRYSTADMMAGIDSAIILIRQYCAENSLKFTSTFI